jgi:anion-transporting  ArsA/GET3 family ATPase
VKRLIAEKRIIVCTGSGGVGKTTLAASIGVIAARAGRRVLVLTVDPARRLAGAMGLAQANGVIEVPVTADGTLHAEMIRPTEIFERYIRRVAPDRDKAEAILGNRLYQELATTLSGSQEFTSLVRLREADSSGEYDLVVLDTPPAEHAAEFLEAPERLASLFDGRVARWLGSDTSGGGLLGGLMRRGTHAALGILQLLTGKAFIAELTGFFDGVRSIAADIRAASLDAHRSLTGPGTAFVLISSLDAAKILEAEDYRQALSDSGYRLGTVIVNRAHPEWFAAASKTTTDALLAAKAPGLAELHSAQSRYFARRGRAHSAFSRLRDHKVEVIKLPELDDEPTGLGGLDRLAAMIVAKRTKKTRTK